MYFTLISFFLFFFAPSKSFLFNQYLRLNLYTTATLETEENGHCREVLNKSQCMDFLSAWTRKSGSFREVAVSGVSTVLEEITKYDHC